MARSPIASSPASPLVSPTAPNGCVVRLNQGKLEVWGVDISEHYAIFLSASGDAIADVVYLGASDLRRAAGEGSLCHG